MTCAHCRKKLGRASSRCPHCGRSNSIASGMFQTSTVLISMGGADRVYRSVADVPAPLRTRLLKSTNGANSATILIADRRGRKEIARAMRKLPNPAQRRLTQALAAADGRTDPIAWLTPGRRNAIVIAIAL